MKLTNTCLAKTNKIIQKKMIPNSEERTRAFRAIRRIINQTYSVARAVSVKWMFSVLNSKRMMLHSVRSLCAKLYNGGNMKKEREMLGLKVMKTKERDSIVSHVREKKKLTVTWKENVNTLKQFRLKKEVESLARSEMIQMKSVYLKQKRKKIDFMINKRTQYKPGDRLGNSQNNMDDDIDSLCTSIMTHDRELPLNFSSEPRIYGGVSINENEKVALKLPPKFTIFENIDKKKCIVEIETMVTKYMWDMRNRNGEEEKEESTNA